MGYAHQSRFQHNAGLVLCSSVRTHRSTLALARRLSTYHGAVLYISMSEAQPLTAVQEQARVPVLPATNPPCPHNPSPG